MIVCWKKKQKLRVKPGTKTEEEEEEEESPDPNRDANGRRRPSQRYYDVLGLSRVIFGFTRDRSDSHDTDQSVSFTFFINKPRIQKQTFDQKNKTSLWGFKVTSHFVVNSPYFEWRINKEKGEKQLLLCDNVELNKLANVSWMLQFFQMLTKLFSQTLAH